MSDDTDGSDGDESSAPEDSEVDPEDTPTFEGQMILGSDGNAESDDSQQS